MHLLDKCFWHELPPSVVPNLLVTSRPSCPVVPKCLFDHVLPRAEDVHQARKMAECICACAREEEEPLQYYRNDCTPVHGRRCSGAHAYVICTLT